jgi:hypothetical protein
VNNLTDAVHTAATAAVVSTGRGFVPHAYNVESGPAQTCCLFVFSQAEVLQLWRNSVTLRTRASRWYLNLMPIQGYYANKTFD